MSRPEKGKIFCSNTHIHKKYLLSNGWIQKKITFTNKSIYKWIDNKYSCSHYKINIYNGCILYKKYIFYIQRWFRFSFSSWEVIRKTKKKKILNFYGIPYGIYTFVIENDDGSSEKMYYVFTLKQQSINFWAPYLKISLDFFILVAIFIFVNFCEWNRN